MTSAESLKTRLAREIALTGPMTVADYVTRCLHDPKGGYYASRPALGEGGDFITAPLVSQMFGELIGLCLADVWLRSGRRADPLYVELGPGRGTLAGDALRAMEGADVTSRIHFVETSPTLREPVRRTPDNASAS